MLAWQLPVFLVFVGIATFAQCLTGFAMALILLGLSGLVGLAPLPDVANVATILSLTSAVVALRAGHKAVDWHILRATAAGSLVGVVGGVTLLGWLQANVVVVLRLLLGMTIVGCAISVLLRAPSARERSPSWSFGLAGILSGVLGGLFAASGPPLVFHFYRQPLSLQATRDTLVAALATSSLVRLAIVVPTGHFSASAVWLSLFAAPLSAALTWWFRGHPPAWSRATVLRGVCALLLLTGTGLIVPSLRAIAPTIPG
jgi:uncharacterized membrane protein YfcA